jgi:hypothetical protein
VDYSHLFQYRADQKDTIRMSGAPVDPSGVNIPISAGWNWIGYVPNYPLPVSTALGSLTPLNGDIIKGQTAFAQYVAGFGWLGSLQYMEPPKGYQFEDQHPGHARVSAAGERRAGAERARTGAAELLDGGPDAI